MAFRNNKRKIGMIVGVVLGVSVILGIANALFGYYWQRRARAQENALKLTARMSGLEESEVGQGSYPHFHLTRS